MEMLHFTEPLPIWASWFIQTTITEASDMADGVVPRKPGFKELG